MNFEQIVSSTISDFQLLMDSLNTSLAVGPINDQDFTILCGGYGKINWEYIICDKYSPYDSLDFTFKLKDNNISVVPLAAFISTYELDTSTLEIHAIENLSRNPLIKGKVFLYSLFACYLFMKKINGKYIKLVDVEQDNYSLRTFYNQFGFIEEGIRDLSISLGSLEEYIKQHLN